MIWEAQPKLYWRVKINGSWTWRPAVVDQEGLPIPPSPEGESK